MSTKAFDVLIVGAGFAGLYMLHRARGLGLSACVLEAGDGVGGTWYWNRYPGARCDVESVQYSYQFSRELQQQWRWTEKYATQAEILRYIEHVADRFELRRDIRCGARVTAAQYDSANARWRVQVATGDDLTARYLILAVGCLSSENRPEIPGIGNFAGASYHTGQWPHGIVDFSGKDVAVIGTGSSGIQCIPKIAQQARLLTVMQRTPNYAIPAWNEPLDDATDRMVKADYDALRARAKTRPTGYWFPFGDTPAMSVSEDERTAQYERFWQLGGLKFMGAFSDLFLDAQANATAAQFVRAKIRAKIHDATVAGIVVPNGVIGAKRLCVESNYYETFNRPNVKVIDIRRTPIERFTPRGLFAGGIEYRFDAVVFATGFDAITGAILRIDITGQDGRSLGEDWRARPRAFLGLATHGFPNLFMINGPGSTSVLSNMVQSIEQHVDWIASCIDYMRRAGKVTVEASAEAQDDWVRHCDEIVSRSVRAAEDSWYLGSNIPGKPRVFLPYAGGFPAYAKKCQQVAHTGYQGLVFTC